MSPLARAGFLTALLGAACITTASAQGVASSPSPSPSPTPLSEIGRIVTSDRRSEALAKTTRPTFVVDRATIEAYGARTVGDALANVPGFDFSPYGAFGAQINYGIRGTSSAQTLVLQDGVPIASGSNGIVDLGSLSTIGVRRIEVVESGSSTLYGTSATGGVINIITDTQVQPYLRLSDGTYGDRDVAAQVGAGGLAVSYERHDAQNVFAYPAFVYPNGTTIPAGTRANDDAEQTTLRLSYQAALAGGWTARLSAGADAIRIGVPGSLAFGTTPDARQGTARSDGLLDLSHPVGRGTLDLTFSGVTQKLAYADPGPALGGEDDTYDARTQASLKYTATAARSDLVTGIDLSRESALLSFSPPAYVTSTQTSSSLAAAESQAAAYVQFGYRPSTATRLTFGLRGENDAPRGTVLAPSFGVNADLGAARLMANIGESFRVPTLIDLYYPGFANPALLPEKLTNYDATLAFPSLLGGVSVGYFGRDGSNLITLDPTTFAPINASRVSVNGLQLVAATRPLHHLRATASLTNLYRAIDTSTGLRIPGTPPIVATLGLDRPFDGGPIALGARVRVVGANADVPNPNGDPLAAPLADPFASYTRADAYIRYRLARNAIATLRVANLGGTAYVPIYGYPAPGRAFSFELSTR